MRILHVLNRPEGGGGAYAVALARAALARGDEVMLWAPRPLDAGLPEVPFHRGSLTSLRRESTGADLVHLHGVRAALTRPLLRGRHAVMTTHGLHQLRATQGLRKWVVGIVTRILLTKLDAVVCVSEAEARDLRALGFPPQRTHVVLNGVPAADVPTEAERDEARRRLGLEPDAFVVLFAGFLVYQKNPQLALDAAALARRSRPELVLLVAGDGELRPELSVPREGVHLLGHRTDMQVLFAAADAVLNTSRWEGLSLALLEGLWRGLPLVVTDGPGNEEAAGDAGLVTRQEPSDIAAALVRLAEDGELRMLLAGRARARAESCFREDAMLERTLALYDTVVGGPGGTDR